MTATTAPTTDAQQAQPWHTFSLSDLFTLQGVDERRGLTTGEAEARRARSGPNRMAETKGEPRWRAFLRQYADPMPILLPESGRGLVYPIKEFGPGCVILFLTLFNAVI